MNPNLITVERDYIIKGWVELAATHYMVRLGIVYDADGKIPAAVKQIVNDYIDSITLAGSELQKHKL